MKKPHINPEVNLNTLLLFLALISTGVGWGVIYNSLVVGQAKNTENIEKLEMRFVVIENTSRVLDNHELRLSNVEVTSRDASAAMRSVEASIHALSSDVRSTREILERIERGQHRAGHQKD